MVFGLRLFISRGDRIAVWSDLLWSDSVVVSGVWCIVGFVFCIVLGIMSSRRVVVEW